MCNKPVSEIQRPVYFVNEVVSTTTPPSTFYSSLTNHNILFIKENL